MSQNNQPNQQDDSPSLDDQLDWFSYQLFGRVADYLIEETSYYKYTEQSAEKASRYYVSRLFFDTIFALLIPVFITLMIYILVTTETIDIFAGLFSAVEFSAIILVFVEFIRFLLDVILFVIEQSTSIFDDVVRTEDVVDTIINAIQNFPIIEAIIGGTVLGASSVIDVLGEFFTGILPDAEFDDIGLLPTDEILEALPEPIEEAITDAEFMRNIFMFIVSPLIALGFFVYKFYRPIYQTNERKRAIDKQLPQATLFLYALTRGGMDIGGAMKQLGESESTYGEVSKVFRDITRRADFGTGDLRQSILAESSKTNHEELEEFLYGLVSVIDTGSDVTRYLEIQTNDSLEEKRKSQESYFSTLDILSEMFVIMFVVAPIFILVIQLVSALTGPFSRILTQLIPYLFVPAGGFVITIILYVLGTARTGATTTIRPPKSLYQVRYEAMTDYTVQQTEITFEDILMKPLNEVARKPYFSLIYTLPIAFIYFSMMIQLQVIPLEAEELADNLLQVTIYGYYVPLLILMAPWTYIYEKQKRRKQRIDRQLPILLENVKEANRRGLTLQESFRAAATADSTELYRKLEQAIKKSEITSELNRALIEFSNDIQTPRLSEAISLLTKANRVSGDVSKAVETVAEDFNELYKIQVQRQQRAREYVSVIFVSLLVGTLLIIALDIVFFTFVSGQEGIEQGGQEVDVLGDIPEDFFRRVFLHTLMSISAVAGIVAGVMENNSPQNGFKYIIAFSTLSILAFTAQAILLG